MNKLTVILLLIGFSLQCQALTELETIDGLAPMAGPDSRNVGWQWHFLDKNGKPGYMVKTAGDDKIASYERSDGCRWTRTTDGFAPATEWAGCPSTGKSSVEILSNSLWPLQVGNRIEYQVRGTSSLIGRAWASKRTCEVTTAVKIEINSGIYDTFKVVCNERWGTRTWWLAPSVGTAVAYQQITKRGGLVRQEMERIISP